MNILVLQEVYPSRESPYSQVWSHTRNKAYIAQGASVKVCCSSEAKPRTYEGIDIFPIHSFKEHAGWCDVILAHQPNLKLHYSVLRNNKNNKVVYFFHGHEVMFINNDYPRPYFFSPDLRLTRRVFRLFYDRFKVFVLRRFFMRQGVELASFVFVSDWMRKIFERRVGLSVDLQRFRYSIIPNSVGDVFLQKSYKLSADIYADFISIRQWDWSKYAVDLVIEAAVKNKDKTFHIYGKGDLLSYVDVPANVKMVDSFLTHDQIPELLNHYRCALMPTRVDSQGVMACEIASYGMPLITSNISVAKEFLSSFPNVSFLGDSDWYSTLKLPVPFSLDLENPFSAEFLCRRELDFFDRFLNAPTVK